MALSTLISDAKFAKELQKQYFIADSLEIFARLEKGWIESAIPNREKLYCPYKNCAKLLSYDPNDEEIIMGKCPWCEGLLCARCRVPWHTGRNCQQFQKQEKDREDDLRVKLLAENHQWKNCPSCNSLVDKVDDGWIHITCRCKEEFCYACGETWCERHWNYIARFVDHITAECWMICCRTKEDHMAFLRFMSLTTFVWMIVTSFIVLLI